MPSISSPNAKKNDSPCRKQYRQNCIKNSKEPFHLGLKVCFSDFERGIMQKKLPWVHVDQGYPAEIT
jgi:hypothetical protein